MTQATHNDALTRYLEQAAADLSSDNTPLSEESDGLLFLGAWHQSYPAILVRDPFLSDSAKIHFLFLMQASCQRPHSAISMPSLEQTAHTLGHSWRTAQRDRTLLRVCRWISQYKRVRDDKGRHRGTINTIHSEPCSLAHASRLDSSYMQLLKAGEEEVDPYISRAAQAALANIDQALATDRDPMAPVDTIERRINAAHAIRSGGGSFYELLMPSGTSQPTGHSVATLETSEKFAYGHPHANSAHGQNKPHANFSHGIHVTDTAEKPEKQSQPGESNPALATSTCTTTTSGSTITNSTNYAHEQSNAGGQGGHTVTSCEANPDLRWPEKLSAEDRVLVERAFVSRDVPAKHRQDLLDALATRMANTDDPIRAPVGYMVRLCQRLNAGTFNPVGPPKSIHASGVGGAETSPVRVEMADVRQQIRNLDSEIEGVKMTLSLGSKTAPEVQSRLETSRDRAMEQRETLKQKLRELQQSLCGSKPSHT